jgi:phage-related protein
VGKNPRTAARKKAEPPPKRVRWYGNTLDILRGWSEAAKDNIGLDLHRLEKGEPALDSEPVRGGISELRDHQDKIWYRVMYAFHAGWIFVLNCFTKKTNQTDPDEIKLAEKRFATVKSWNVAPYPKSENEVDPSGEEKKSA